MASRIPIATSFRLPGALSKAFPIACCGAPTGRIPISRIRCRTTACWSTSFRTSRSRPNCSASCWSIIRCGCIGRRSCRVGKANGSRECAPDGVPTIDVRWWARRKSAFAHPTKFLQILDDPGVDQESVEAPCFGAVLAGVEQALAAEHDLLLLLEGRIEGYAGGFLDHQRQIGGIDGVHHRRALY